MAITPTVAAIIAAGGVERYAVAEGIDPGAMCRAVHRLRAVYDFEFWCISCVKIFDKTSGRLVPFKLRWAQLKLVRILLCDLFAGKPVRIVLLKARQWGGSTVVQMFMAWIQLFHRSGWNSVIVADVEDQARTIRAMYSRMARRHPVEICSVQFCNFEGSSKNKMLVDRDCVVSIGSMQKPDSLRSGDMKMAHLSEVGLWKKTKERKPEDVIQTILGSVPREPFTVVGVVSQKSSFEPRINSVKDYAMYVQESSGLAFVPTSVWPVLYRLDVRYLLDNGPERVDFHIYDLQGNMQLTQRGTNGATTSFDVSRLPDGMYILKARCGQANDSRKFTVRHP